MWQKAALAAVIALVGMVAAVGKSTHLGPAEPGEMNVDPLCAAQVEDRTSAPQSVLETAMTVDRSRTVPFHKTSFRNWQRFVGPDHKRSAATQL